MLQMTNSYLQTQQHVMLLYLNSRSASVKAMPCLDVQPETVPVIIPTPVMRQMSAPIAAQTNPAPTIQVCGNEAQEQSQTNVSIPVNSNATSHGIESPPENAPAKAIARDSESLVTACIELISQRTGYPVDMLDPDLDLESDLGIDSIKRVEILSNFRRLLSEEMQEQFEGSLEELAGLRTIQGISDWIRQIPQPG